MPPVMKKNGVEPVAAEMTALTVPGVVGGEIAIRASQASCHWLATYHQQSPNSHAMKAAIPSLVNDQAVLVLAEGGYVLPDVVLLMEGAEYQTDTKWTGSAYVTTVAYRGKAPADGKQYFAECVGSVLVLSGGECYAAAFQFKKGKCDWLRTIVEKRQGASDFKAFIESAVTLTTKQVQSKSSSYCYPVMKGTVVNLTVPQLKAINDFMASEEGKAEIQAAIEAGRKKKAEFEAMCK